MTHPKFDSNGQSASVKMQSQHSCWRERGSLCMSGKERDGRDLSKSSSFISKVSHDTGFGAGRQSQAPTLPTCWL